MAKLDDETVIGVTAFKARCLALIEGVVQRKTSRVVLMRHSRPVAALVPFAEPPTDLWGALRGSVTVPAGTDLSEGVGDVWDAER